LKQPILHEPLGQADTFQDTFQRLRDDEELYHLACLKIRTKEGELVPLKWNFAQRYVSRKLAEQWKAHHRVRAIILKARQEGVSTLTAARFMRSLNLYSGVKALVIADSLERAGAVFSIYERFDLNLPHELRPEVLGQAARRSLRYAHDSEVSVRPASDKDAGRAQTTHKLHATEIAMWPISTQRDTWVSATSAVPDYGSEIIVESTAKGAGGLFYELWNKAVDPASGWLAIFLPWWIHEEYDAGYGEHNPSPMPDELEAIATTPDEFEKTALAAGIPWEGKNFVLPLSRLVWRRRRIVTQFGGDPVTLGEDATRDFQEEFPATAEEAFIASGALYFEEARLRELAQKVRDPIKQGKLVEEHIKVGDQTIKVVTLQENKRGFIRVWEEPQVVPEKPPKDFVLSHYTIGADTAEGKLTVKQESTSTLKEDRDYSAGAVVSVPPRGGAPGLAATIHGWIPADIFAKQLALLGEWYECGGPADKPVSTRRAPAKLCVESNHASGQRVLQYLKEIIRYPNVYWQRTFNTRTDTFEPKIGWRTDERSRDILLDGLGELIRKSQIIVPDPDTVRELGQFVYGKDGKPGALDGAHDDRVFALALAIQMALKEHRHAVTSAPPSWETIQAVTGET
jgi:hypothetical protein